MSKFTMLLAALIIATPVLASPARDWNDKRSASASKLEEARKALVAAVKKEKDMPAVSAQRADLWKKTGWDKAMLPGLVASSEIMSAAAATAEGDVAAYLKDLAATYASMAKTLDPKVEIRTAVSKDEAMKVATNANRKWSRATMKIAAMNNAGLTATRAQDAVLVQKSPVRKAMDTAFTAVRGGHKLLMKADVGRETGAILAAAVQLDNAMVRGTSIPKPVQAPAPSS